MEVILETILNIWPNTIKLIFSDKRVAISLIFISLGLLVFFSTKLVDKFMEE